MSAYLITITPRGRAAWCYRGIFGHAIDALIHGLDTSADPQARISVRRMGADSGARA